jgi:hypothetical protein
MRRFFITSLSSVRIAYLLYAVPKPPGLAPAWCVMPNPTRWIATNYFAESHAFGVNLFGPGGAGDDIEGERFSALNQCRASAAAHGPGTP